MLIPVIHQTHIHYLANNILTCSAKNRTSSKATDQVINTTILLSQ